MSHCQNYCDCLFSLNGAAPTHLPPSIRLENGQTRCPVYVSIEDINSLGYVGPISVPEYDKDTQYLEWDSDTLAFTVHERTSPYSVFQTDDTEDYKVRLTLGREAETLQEELFGSSLSPVGVQAYVERYKYVTQLLDSPDNLRFSDVENFVTDLNYYSSNVAAAQEEFDRDNQIASGCYHYFGFVPKLYGTVLTPETFSLNEAWTQNLDRNIAFTAFPKEGGSRGTVGVSGYNIVTGANTYDILPGHTINLIFNAVFYPND